MYELRKRAESAEAALDRAIELLREYRASGVSYEAATYCETQISKALSSESSAFLAEQGKGSR